MRKMWWKYLLGLALLIVIAFSLRTPLSPGILSVHDNELSAEDPTLAIIGYHTHFSSATDLQVWLEYEGWTACASKVQALDETHLLATFDTEMSVPSKVLNLFINTKEDGTLLTLNGVRTVGIDIATSGLPRDKCYESLAATTHEGYTLPFRVILWETIRNLNFHVPMWFAMIFIMGLSMVLSIRHLGSNSLDHDDKASAAVRVGLVFAFCGLATGSLWAKFTWGAWWTSDKQLNGAAMVTLIYLAYLLLRSSLEDDAKRARISAVYNIFAFVMMILFIFVLPRMGSSIELHPGKGGNPAFSNYDLDNKLRLLFYPAVICWIGMAYWMYTLRYRLQRINRRIDDRYDD